MPTPNMKATIAETAKVRSANSRTWRIGFEVRNSTTTKPIAASAATSSQELT